MTIVEAFLLSLSLCVDSLVVSTTTALHSKMSMRRGVLMALIFGVCQGAFPLTGALIGDAARSFIEAVDHWVAFGLLLGVGGKMVVDGCRSKEAEPVRQKVTVGAMALLGVATSIDAFAVGIGLGIEHSLRDVLWTVAMIGGLTLTVSLVGVHLGRRNIPVPERAATIGAGVVLVGLGTKILVEHLLGL